jgi:hypothetical protein
LQLRNDRRSVEIFHHASFLHYQGKRYVIYHATTLMHCSYHLTARYIRRVYWTKQLEH